MKARPDLKHDSSTVLSSPNNYYIDPDGKVNEIEDDDERILFGTVANPSSIEGLAPVIVRTDEWLEQLRNKKSKPESAEDRLWKQASEDTRVACDPQFNPHLKALDAIIDVLEK